MLTFFVQDTLKQKLLIKKPTPVGFFILNQTNTASYFCALVLSKILSAEAATNPV